MKYINKFILLLSSQHKQTRLRNISITTKLVVCFSFVFIFMLLLSFANFTYYKKDKEVATINVIKQTNRQSMQKVDQLFSDMNSVSKSPLLYNELSENIIEKLIVFNKTNTNSISLRNDAQRMFDYILNYKDTVYSVFLFNLHGNCEYKMRNGSLSGQYNPINEKWFRESIDRFGKPVYISTFLLPNVANTNNQPVYVFSLSRAVIDMKTSDVVGIILVNVKADFLAEVSQAMIITKGQRVIFTDKNNKIVFDTNQSNITKKLDTNIINAIKNSSNDTMTANIEGVQSLISVKPSELTGWKIINIIPVNALNKGIYNMGTKTIIITLIVVLATFSLTVFISRQIVIPLKKLVILMKLVENGDFDLEFKIRSSDEIGILGNAFNNMTKKINSLINEVYRNKIKQKDLEIQMLQYQINPHFLYNALDAINMEAEINEDYTTAKMAMTLGKILRYGINRKITNVTVSDEINNLNDYILFQGNRFEEIYEIIINVDESIHDKPIIKLILQPLVENAIYHGISSRIDGGIIAVTGYRKDDTLIFEVKDNGKGMDIEQVKKLNDYINGLNESYKSIGLRNVNTRIKLHYGNEYGLEISSAINQGTRVRVMLPSVDP